MEQFLLQLFIFLTSAAIAVPLAKKLGLGSVLGYLIAGIVIGPYGLSLIDHIEDIMHFTEFGVVMMLFPRRPRAQAITSLANAHTDPGHGRHASDCDQYRREHGLDCVSPLATSNCSWPHPIALFNSHRLTNFAGKRANEYLRR